MIFELVRLRLRFRVSETLRFPAGKAGNVLRGGFGMMLRETAPDSEYRRIFAAKLAGGPSGFADAPRPFVIRAAHLDGCTFPPGSELQFDVHLFDLSNDVRTRVISAFAKLGQTGFGPGRVRATLLVAGQEHVLIDLSATAESAACVRVRFVTPTELKGAARPDFPVLFARLRDRISMLRALYGPGPLDIAFRALGERAAAVRMSRCELIWDLTERRSSRTGETHPIGGFTGEAEYHGDLGEFLPYLRVGEWTGVGRQTVWGKGMIACQILI